jgi:hypothetical protein
MRKMGRTGNHVWRDSTMVRIIIVTALLAGCAPAPSGAPPRVMQQSDFKMLSGAWLGSTDIQGQLSTEIQGVIQETGAFYTVPRAGGGQTPGVMKVESGGVVYETATSKGKMTFHEAETAWTWRWDGMTTDGRYVRNVLTKSK